MRSARNFFIAALVGGIIGVMAPKASAQTDPFRPNFTGYCTDGAWIMWVKNLGHSGVPSLRNAKYWWDDAPANKFSRSTVPPVVPSILVLDGWDTNPYGHVAVTTWSTDKWSPGWQLLWTAQFNWSPNTVGNSNAQFQYFYVAYYPPTGQCWYWYGDHWSSRSYPVRGFVY